MLSSKNRCQSCSMPLSKDKQGGGTEKNGSHSTTYCSFCYDQGSFTDPNLTLEDMRRKLNIVLKRMRTNAIMTKFILWRLQYLKRWR